MSDQRREAVGWAIANVLNSGVHYSRDDLADAALAAIDATEPTDAEVDAAAQAYVDYLEEVDPGIAVLAPPAMRAALIAARKART